MSDLSTILKRAYNDKQFKNCSLEYINDNGYYNNQIFYACEYYYRSILCVKILKPIARVGNEVNCSLYVQINEGGTITYSPPKKVVIKYKTFGMNCNKNITHNNILDIVERKKLKRKRNIDDIEINKKESYIDDVTCTICVTNKKQMCCVPCGHMFCGSCADKIKDKCFICKENIDTIIKTF